MVMKMMSALKHPSLAAMLFFVLFSFFKLSCSIGNICPDLEKQALLSFKQSLYDPNNKLSSWNDDEVNCCEWKGVLCSNLTGHVQQLDLQMSFLSGKVSPSLLNLNYLKYLDLSGNNFNETIPPFIGSLTSLEYLDLSYAEFHGKIPHTIGNLSNLHNLILESKFSLEVVSLEWMARLSKIEYLNMNGVDLSRVSDWQHVINKLPSLVELHLSGCNLNFTSPLSDVSNNITTSNLAILDLSAWNAPFQLTSASILPKWIFRLGNLTYLDLSAIMFEGPIPTVSNTTKLKHINLSNNNFNSSIPGWLYFLKDLEYLNLLSNNLQDAISNSIANLTSLSTLDLSANELYGEIPRGLFKNLCELSDLDLSQNYKLQGGVSDLFGNASDCFLGSLESLYLNGNQFSGPLANPFAEFKRLRILDLSNNSLSGVIPSNIGNLSSSLEQIDLSDNKFRGNLPETICQLSNLQYLKIDNNMLEGVVTETHFSLLSRLDTLSASGNNLTLKVNPNWIPPFKLFALRMGSWNLGSPIIPPWLDTQKTSIEHLDLSNTGIYGNVPNWLWSMKFLNISHNQLHGSIWVISDPWPTITTMYQFLYFGSNKFSGSLPLVGKYLVDLDLSNNSFSGDLSHFLCTRSAYRLENLQLEGNQLTGELPNCFTKWPYLRMLNLGSNNFSGRIPYSVGFLTSLKSLNLQRNNFSGSIPFSMHTCTELLKIDLSDNNLSGNLSKQIVTSLSKLVILILKSNKLSGEITSAICQLSSLQILDLSDNMFFGMIPTCVNNFTAMATKRSAFTLSYSSFNENVLIEYASIFTKGMELTYDNTLFLVTSIDLSNNNLSGDIPKEITSLVELRTLNLFGNHLTGMIPLSIGNMTQLESLDLSINSLSGEFPNSFRIMSTLNYLNVSYNKLTGRIPQSTQFCSFNESSFIGNNLSGPPLTGSCTSSTYNVGKVPVTKHSLDGEGDKPEIEWLYVLISLGYAIGLSGFLTTIFLKRSWREAYFESIENVWDSAYVYLHIIWRKLKGAFQYA